MRTRARFELWVHLAVLCANNGLCVYCNEARSEVMDHVIPLAQEGADALGNLVPACDACNESKGDKAPPDWITSALLRNCWAPANGMPGDENHGLRARSAQVCRKYEETQRRIDAVLGEIDDRTRRRWILWKTTFQGVPGSRAEISAFRDEIEPELKRVQNEGFPHPWNGYRSMTSLFPPQRTDQEMPGERSPGL